MNQSILYWKWDEKVFEGNTLAVLLDDMLKRSSFKMLYVSFHHISRPYDDKELYEAIEYTVGRLAEDGRKRCSTWTRETNTPLSIRNIPIRKL